MLVSVAIVALGLVGRAAAAEDPAAIRMRPNHMLRPDLGLDVGVEGTLDPDDPLLVVAAVGFRGVRGGLPGRTWLPVRGGVAVDPFDLAAAPVDPPRFDGRVALQRRAGETSPIVATSDLWLGVVSARRDRPVAVELDAAVQAVDWTGALHLPAMFPRDIDARLLVGGRALGARWRRFTEAGALPEYRGVALAGVTGELVYGRMLVPRVILTGRLGGDADWSPGDAGGFVLLTDTRVWIAGNLALGPRHDLRLELSNRAADDDQGAAHTAPGLALTWRGAW